jgi:hypothetical protein
MTNSHRYFVEERKDGTIAVKGEGKERAARVLDEGAGAKAEKLAHHYASDGGVVEFKNTHGKFEKCLCAKCKSNR